MIATDNKTADKCKGLSAVFVYKIKNCKILTIRILNSIIKIKYLFFADFGAVSKTKSAQSENANNV